VVDYEGGKVDVTFTEKPSAGQSITFVFEHTVNYFVPPSTEILVNYYYTELPLEITEAGLFSDDGTMISYATFPPLEFNGPENHVNVVFAFRKDKIFDPKINEELLVPDEGADMKLAGDHRLAGEYIVGGDVVHGLL
jgi:hypothetical protein